MVPLSATILAEARELLSVLRRNRRYGYLLPFQSAPAHAPEHPLVKELKTVRDVMRVSPAPATPVPPPDALLNALEPFFDVVRSRDASGIITGVALQSLCRIAARLITLSSAASSLPAYGTVLGAIVDAAAACRFDATDPASDEVVLSRITRVVSTVCASHLAAPLLADAVMLRALEACLAIAAGKRRASDLLKRSADAVLVDVFAAMGHNLRSVADTPASKAVPHADQLAAPVVAHTPAAHATAFGYALDSDALSQHGPLSLAFVAAALHLACRMADPSYAQSLSERALGLQLLAAFVAAAGPDLTTVLPIKRILLREGARGLLRSLGLFKSQPSLISYAFSVAIHLVHALQHDVSPFLLALLERVFPYYISGFENVLPRTRPAAPADRPDSGAAANAAPPGGAAANGAPPSGTTPDDGGPGAPGTEKPIEIDPVIREIGLEALADLLSIPGLLCVVYRLADCDMRRPDVVEPFLKALGHAAKIIGLRRRTKRLRASTSGSSRVGNGSAAANDDDLDSDDDDALFTNSSSAAAAAAAKHGSAAHSANPEAARFNRAAALLCANSVLNVIDTISDRLKLENTGVTASSFMDTAAYESSRNVRADKVRLQLAAAAFNKSEKVRKASKLLVLLREHGLVSPKKDGVDGTVQQDLEDDVAAVVKFIRFTPGLVKDKIGDIIGEPDSISRKVLADYTNTFDFEGRQFTESLRVFLESFRLPGEAQKIDRIVESFADRYFQQNNPKNTSAPANHPSPQPTNGSTSESPTAANTTESVGAASENTNGDNANHELSVDRNNDQPSSTQSVLKNSEAAYVLSFSVVMLNTDQHNDSIKKKMTIEDFVKNCRGINDGEDLPNWFLGQVFDSIAAVEIRMSDEAGVGALTDLLWDEQLRKAGAFDDNQFPEASKSRIFDDQVFQLSWEAGIVAANSILKEAGEPNSVQKALEGFLSVSRCATTFNLSKPTDAVIASLCNATTVREGPLYGTISRFGTDIKAQMASVALSGVSRECGDWLRLDGWQALVAYFMRLHALCLLPSEFEQAIGGYGSELVGVEKKRIDSSTLIPAWWPSRVTDNIDLSAEIKKPKKQARPNNFFAALIASIGPEADNNNDDEDDDNDEEYYANGHTNENATNGTVKRRASRVPPHYIRTRNREDTEARELAKKCIAGCRIEDIVINEAKVLQSTSLKFLCKSVAQIAFKLIDSSTDGEDKSNEEEPLQKDEGNGVLDWNDIAPRNNTGENAVISGIRTNIGLISRVDTDHDSFPSFGGSSSDGWEGATREKDERKAREFIISFCIDVLCELTLQNRDRLNIPWPELHGLLVRIIAPATESLAVLERAVVALLRVGIRLLHRDEIRDDVLRGFSLLVRLPVDMAEALCIPVASGVYNIVRGHGGMIQNTSGWHAILSIVESLARYQEKARFIGLETVKWILLEVSNDSVAVSAKTYAPLLDTILAYTSCASVDTSIQALDLLYMLSQRISSFGVRSNNDTDSDTGSGARSSEDELWAEYWGPLFLGFASGVRDPRGKVRNCALGVMERVIASRGSTELLTANQWNNVLSGVVLPLMTQLFATRGYYAGTLDAERDAQRRLHQGAVDLEDHIVRSVSAACNRTRMRAMVLTSKTFLQHHLAIAAALPHDDFTTLWMSVLEVFRVAVHPDDDRPAPEGDDVTEHVPESVKNMLLVMCDCGLLNRDMSTRWNATFSLVGQFIPDIEQVVAAATGQPLPATQDDNQEQQQPEQQPEQNGVAHQGTATTADAGENGQDADAQAQHPTPQQLPDPHAELPAEQQHSQNTEHGEQPSASGTSSVAVST